MQLIAASDFANPVAVPALGDDEIHLWLLDQPPSLAPRALSAFAHAEVGRLLEAYGGAAIPPTLLRDMHGKPYALEPGYPHFNLSHGGRRIALAFSRAGPVGIDVEAVRDRRAPLELAQRFFAREEAEALARLDESERGQAFLYLWTCKEAVLKACGRGIAFGLDRLRFELAGTDPHALVEIAEEGGRVGDWQVRRFDAGRGHAGALAWSGPALRVRAFAAIPAAPGPAADT